MLDVNDHMAEVAFSVADAYQGRHIGTHLLRFLIRAAQEQGIKGFKAIVLAENTTMMRVFRRSGCILHTEYESGEIFLSFRFDEKVVSS